MTVKPNILSGYKSIDHVGRNIFVICPGPVLNVKLAEQDIVFRIDFGGKVAGRVFKLLERWKRTEFLYRDKDEESGQENYGCGDYHPEPDSLFTEFFIPQDRK